MPDTSSRDRIETAVRALCEQGATLQQIAGVVQDLRYQAQSDLTVQPPGVILADENVRDHLRSMRWHQQQPGHPRPLDLDL